MPRIRSVHPGLFTDEAFVSLSDAAQILLIGLWTECDDQGAFEWKPLTLRMRLRQNRDGPVEPLLAEMEALNCIMSYEHKGRKLGLVRNFRKWQRPKRPNKVYFVPPEFGTYTLPAGNSSEPEHDEQDDVPNSPPLEATSVPPKAELAPQREDGGGMRLDEGGRKKERPPLSPPDGGAVETRKDFENGKRGGRKNRYSIRSSFEQAVAFIEARDRAKASGPGGGEEGLPDDPGLLS